MDKKRILPALALIGGATGFGLRKIELATVFVAETGLPQKGAAVSIALIALSVVMGLLFFLLSPSSDTLKDSNYHQAFGGCQNGLYVVGGVVAVFATLIAGVLLIYGGVSTQPLVLTQLILGVGCVAAAPFQFSVIKANTTQGKEQGYVGALLAPAFVTCLWLIVSYQSQAANPVVLDYIYGLLAIICLLIGLYQMAGFSFEKPKVKGMCVFSLFGVHCTFITMADAHELWEYALLGGMALFLLVHTGVLLANIEKNPSGARLNKENKGGNLHDG